MKTEDLIVDIKHRKPETPMGVSGSAPAGRLANPEVPQNGPDKVWINKPINLEPKT